MSNVRSFATSLVLLSSFAAAPGWAVPSTSVTVSGQVIAPTTFGYSALQALPQTTRTETYRAGGTPVTDTFIGPTLWGVLNASGGIATNPAVKNDALQTYVIATGTDGYRSVISTGEIAPNLGHKPDLVAIGDTGGTLPGSAGVARVTASGDVAGGRYVSNSASLQVGHGPTIAGTGGGVTTSFTVGGAVNTPISFTLPSLQALTPYTQTVTYNAGARPSPTPIPARCCGTCCRARASRPIHRSRTTSCAGPWSRRKRRLFGRLRGRRTQPDVRQRTDPGRL